MVCIMWLMKTTITLTHSPLICLFYREQYTTTRLLILDSNVLSIHILGLIFFLIQSCNWEEIDLEGTIANATSMARLGQGSWPTCKKAEHTHTKTRKQNKTTKTKTTWKPHSPNTNSLLGRTAFTLKHEL